MDASFYQQFGIKNCQEFDAPIHALVWPDGPYSKIRQMDLGTLHCYGGACEYITSTGNGFKYKRYLTKTSMINSIIGKQFDGLVHTRYGTKAIYNLHIELNNRYEHFDLSKCFVYNNDKHIIFDSHLKYVTTTDDLTIWFKSIYGNATKTVDFSRLHNMKLVKDDIFEDTKNWLIYVDTLKNFEIADLYELTCGEAEHVEINFVTQDDKQCIAKLQKIEKDGKFCYKVIEMFDSPTNLVISDKSKIQRCIQDLFNEATQPIKSYIYDLTQ